MKRMDNNNKPLLDEYWKKQDMRKALLCNIRTQTSDMHSLNEGQMEAAQKEKDESKKEKRKKPTYNELNICVPLKCICWCPNPNTVVFEGGDFWR